MFFELPSERKPLVSVIVRTVDRPHYLREALTSVLVQDYENLEVIVVNDGGPSIAHIVREIGFSFPYQVVEYKENRGRSECSNAGLERANGEYICFVDDDDIFYPFHVSTLVRALQESGRRVAYTDAVQASQVRCPFNDKIYSTTEMSLVLSEEHDFQDLLGRNYIPILCALFHRSFVDQGERFDKALDVLEDWDFWIRLAKGGDFLHVKEITCEYRFRVDGSNTVGQLKHVWDWCRNRITGKYKELKKPLEITEGPDAATSVETP